MGARRPYLLLITPNSTSVPIHSSSTRITFPCLDITLHSPEITKKRRHACKSRTRRLCFLLPLPSLGNRPPSIHLHPQHLALPRRHPTASEIARTKRRQARKSRTRCPFLLIPLPHSESTLHSSISTRNTCPHLYVTRQRQERPKKKGGRRAKCVPAPSASFYPFPLSETTPRPSICTCNTFPCLDVTLWSPEIKKGRRACKMCPPPVPHPSPISLGIWPSSIHLACATPPPVSTSPNGYLNLPTKWPRVRKSVYPMPVSPPPSLKHIPRDPFSKPSSSLYVTQPAPPPPVSFYQAHEAGIANLVQTFALST
jgi:hypothetical protein